MHTDTESYDEDEYEVGNYDWMLRLWILILLFEICSKSTILYSEDFKCEVEEPIEVVEDLLSLCLGTYSFHHKIPQTSRTILIKPSRMVATTNMAARLKAMTRTRMRSTTFILELWILFLIFGMCFGPSFYSGGQRA